MADDQRRGEVVVHGFVAFCAQLLHNLLRLRIALVRYRHAVEVAYAVHKPFKAFLTGLESLVGEVDSAAVVGRKDEETYRHRTVSLLQRRMAAREELLQCDEVAEALAHLLPVDGYHVVVHPVVHHLVALTCHSLCNLTFVMRENEVETAAVYVEVVAKILASHGRALAVPSGESVAPRTGPAHDVLGQSLLPDGEVHLVVFLAHSVELAAGVDNVVEVAAREYAVLMVLVVFHHIEVHGAVALVGIAVVENLLHELLLLDDVAGGVRLNARRQHAEGFHGGMVAVGVVLGYFHGLELLEAGLLCYFVVTLVGVVLQVAHVGDVAHVAHLVAKMTQITENDVESDGGTGVAQMWVAVYCRSAHIHAHIGCMQRHKSLLAAA